MNTFEFSNRPKALVIGAGIGGLAVSIRLALKGYAVEVYEANSYAGGKLSEIQVGDYRFDAGPSLFTLPDLVDELFSMAGKNPRAYFNYIKIPEVCRYFWDDGCRLSASENPDVFDAEISKVLKEKPGLVKKYLKDSAFKYEILDKLFLQDSLHKWQTWLNKDALRAYANLGKLGILSKLAPYNEAFFSQEKTAQLFNRYATYNGSDPYKTPATMSIIPHLEYNIGAFFPEGGMNSISLALQKLGEEIGVKYHFGTRVERIIHTHKKVTGIKLDTGEVINGDIVVSNMDVNPSYRKLMPTVKVPERILNQEKSGSGLIFYWGLNRTFEELDLHNIFFSSDYKTEFEYQFERKSIYHDPTVYINISSKYEQTDAPAGHENWFVLINAPNNSGQDWDRIINETRENIIRKVSKILNVDLREHIVAEAILDPRSIESRTSSAQGALYGNSSNNKFAAFLRHNNQSKQFKNLFFVGGSVHPGGGIPLALSSAKIVDKLMGKTF
jgi:phytoene desaturase